MGDTPSKTSKTGREVKEKMRESGKFKEVDGTEYSWSRKKKDWYPLSEADMAHYPKDAVDFWNENLATETPKSESIRRFMLGSENYEFELSSVNRSQGAKSGKRYLDPINY